MHQAEFESYIKEIMVQLGIPHSAVIDRGLKLQIPENNLCELIEEVTGNKILLASAALEAWRSMKNDALADNISIYIVSGFRSVERQVDIIRRKLEKGVLLSEILKVNAVPGYSEHHSGRAIDINSIGSEPLAENFDKTEAFSWLMSNAKKYGFTLSYPRDNKYGYIYEPWHWLYG